jgi:hypothetical protein
MKIQKTEKYDDNRKEFKVIEYCCAEMGREMNYYKNWGIFDGEMSCGDYEGGVGGKYCSHCGQKIEIVE